MKNRKYLIYGFIAIVIVVAIILIIIFGGKKGIKDNEKFASEYTEVGQNNVFVYRDFDEIVKILEGGTGIVYFGFPECPWCQAYVPMLNEVAKEKNIEKIYYYNIREDRQNNNKNYQKLVKLLKNYLSKDDEGNERIYVPDIYAVKNGKILSHNNETSIVSGDVTPSSYWTEDKKQNIKNIFRNMIDEIYNDVCTTCN